MKKALDAGTWFDTNIMYWWFEVLKDRYPDVYFYDPSAFVSSGCRTHLHLLLHVYFRYWLIILFLSMQSWWRSNNTKALQDNVWGRDGTKVWEASKKRLLIFIMWHEHHFTLLVGYNEERRWEFYNSLKSDRTTVNVAKEFVSTLIQMLLILQFVPIMKIPSMCELCYNHVLSCMNRLTTSAINSLIMDGTTLGCGHCL